MIVLINSIAGVFEFSKIERIAAKLKPVDFITIIYQLMIMLTIIFYYPAIQYAGYFIIFHVTAIGFVIWLTLADNNNVAQIIRPWNPIIIIPLNFSQLHYLVHPVSPFDWDNALIHFDYLLFGIHPTVWLERWLNPGLTEYLQLVYTSFYFIPIVLAIILYKQRDFEKFDFFVFITVFGFYLSYIGYFLVPALGPRFTLSANQNEPLQGLWLTERIRHVLNVLEGIQRDAFPSGHTEITLLTMYYAWKFSRIYFWVLTVLGTSLVFSTVYLRYHYVIDIIAGLWLTIFVLVIVKPVYDSICRWQQLKQSL